ncbi:pumilio homolog 3 isoform X2 [Cimex lectularius]|uniref:PUM-HD domain-containing protein n=1 Tax=Cimex lectularius TaxID=79782 RepID=A0A8I6TGY6_CIMLE|nr:pumilio homolog 3 isoform X2 [Cimex lectularius]
MKRKSTESEGMEVPVEKTIVAKKFKPSKTPTKTKNTKFIKGKPSKKMFGKDSTKAFQGGTMEKPEWAGIKKKHKEVTLQRKLKRNTSIHSELQEAKKLFEVIRTKKCPLSERNNHVKKLAASVKGNLDKMVMRHDTARIIQWLLKLGTPEVKESIVSELINDVVVLVRSKYSNHIIKCILKSCNSSTQRQLIQNCYGHVLKLLSSKISAPIIEDMYSNYANKKEKMLLKKELYGDLLKNTTETDLGKALQENVTLKPAILRKIHTMLTQLLAKKWSYNSNLVMSTVLDYIQNCEEKEKTEIFEILKSDISLLIKTKFGANVGFYLIWNCSAKGKKDIVKELKCDLRNIAMTEAGSMFLLHLIDSVDDTVLMKKALLPTIIDCAEKLVQNEHGKRVILYLFAHRDTHFFHPSYIEKLKMADTSSNVKKSQEKRMNELLECCLNPIFIQIRDNPKAWLANGSVSLVTAAILRQGTDSNPLIAETYSSLAQYCTDLESMKDDKTTCIIEDAGVHKALKQIIKHDQVLHESGKITFSASLVESLKKQTLEKWLTFSRGCFTLLFLLETNIEGVLSELRKKFKETSNFEALKTSEQTGAKLLYKKAKELNFI